MNSSSSKSKQIKERKQFYVIHLKGWATIEVVEEAYQILRKALVEQEKGFIEVGWMILNRFEITKVEPKIVDGIQAYILSQPKLMRDKIALEKKRRGTPRNSVEHVSIFVTANTDAN